MTLNNTSTDLGLALLVAEFDGGSYELVSMAATRAEAEELVHHDMVRRMRDLEKGAEPTCPTVYKLWARTHTGGFQVAAEIKP